MIHAHPCATRALLVAAGFAVATTAHAADHLDAPNVQTDGSLDINDLYAFQSKENPDNTVFIFTVNPGAGAISGTDFSSTGRYQLQIDNDGDAVPNLAYSVSFGAPAAGGQSYTVSREDLDAVPTANAGVVIPDYASGVTEANVATSAGGTVRAGRFEDPFFFDLNGFNDGFNFTGDDFFAGLDVTAFVLEVPSSELGGPNIGVTARTEIANGSQFDRMGRPAINTVLIPSARKDEFNEADPASDFAAFGDDVRATIAALNGGDTATAAALAGVLLPDVLTLDVTSAVGYLNGRGLEDNVIDTSLNLLTNGAVTSDGVLTNDVPFLNIFPYLAAPNNPVPEPTTALLTATGLLALVRRRR